MSPGYLEADVDRYRQAAAANTAPPQVGSDPLVSGLTPVEQLLRVLGLAANLGDEQDNTDSADEHGERDAKTTEAAEEFAAQDAQSSAQLAQQIPQLASGIAGALGGAMGGVMQPIAQIPQQLAQGAQQAMQAGMGLLQQAGGSSAALGDTDLGDLADEPLTEDFAAEAGEFGGGGAGGLDGLGGGGAPGGGAGPGAMLGPPAPTSAGTFASSARSVALAPPSAPSHAGAPGAGMAGVPMVPPAAMNGAAVADKDTKTDTKRVTVPSVRNGAPVQGRIAVPPADPTTTATATAKGPGKPVATRRIIVSRDGPADPGDPAGRP